MAVWPACILYLVASVPGLLYASRYEGGLAADVELSELRGLGACTICMRQHALIMSPPPSSSVPCPLL